ncbi:MAG TPA: NAD-dependent epimerase/dehydratase family protein [Nanoarchaeota archaeon]|nr:NAD-dependent epimerase/dehydratase family protein [Nanoarchaeota archaeon]HIH63864.1 NAD-dependent epimerase/dehydratase family protein [Nanoarchaeota archaeon]HIJ09763.1 NAD-dependent epimerase/dehydratase family protein [Nanoarchaeota archaeon]
MKKILICGATGFIGRNVAEYFSDKESYEVFGTYFKSMPYNNSKINFLEADLTKKEDVNRIIKGKDIIIQAAAYCTGSKDIIDRPYVHTTENVIMNTLIFREAFEQGVSHVIFPSCTTMYGSSDIPVKEDSFSHEKIPEKYLACGKMKVYLEDMCKLFSNFGETKFTAMRHSNLYGPYDRFDLEKSHVFGATITKVMQAKEGNKINVWGTGEEERDLLYVLDMVDFISKAIDKQQTPYELVNVGLGKSISVSDLVKKIIDISGKNLGIEYDSTKPTIKTKLALDCSKAKENFGWEPQVSLEEGIQKTIYWYKENIKS